MTSTTFLILNRFFLVTLDCSFKSIARAYRRSYSKLSLFFVLFITATRFENPTSEFKWAKLVIIDFQLLCWTLVFLVESQKLEHGIWLNLIHDIFTKWVSNSTLIWNWKLRNPSFWHFLFQRFIFTLKLKKKGFHQFNNSLIRTLHILIQFI